MAAPAGASSPSATLHRSPCSRGIITMIFWSFWIGLIVTLVGLVAFGGFARDKWY